MHDAKCDGSLTLSWMPSLIKAQAITDVGVRLAVRHESALRGDSPTCRENCSGCCSSRHVAATKLEMAGAVWHLRWESSPRALEALARIAGEGIGADGSEGCPLLVDGTCAAYPMRFLSCRQLVVFGRACSQGEAPYRTRRADVLTPLRAYALKAQSLLLPHLGVDRVPRDPREVEARLAGLLEPVTSYRIADPVAFLNTLEHDRAETSKKAA